MNHPILQTTRKQEILSVPELPPSALYDAVAGVWLLDGELLTREPRMALVTKKKDIESGEDVKGS